MEQLESIKMACGDKSGRKVSRGPWASKSLEPSWFGLVDTDVDIY